MGFEDVLGLLNPNREIAFGLKLNDLENLKRDELIDTLNKRFIDFYLNPMKELERVVKKPKGTNLGFIIISSCCTLIDILSEYVYPFENALKKSIGKKLDPSIGNRFIKFLITWNPNEFGRVFTNEVTNFYYNEKGELKAINTKGLKYAKAFWYQFRCSVIHNASFGPYGGYDFGQSILFKEYPFVDNLGRDRVELGVNPSLLLTEIERIMNLYFIKLKKPLHEKLRFSFFEKIKRDFGLILI